MEFSDWFSQQAWLPAAGWLVSSAMGIHGLHLAGKNLSRSLAYIAGCIAIAGFTLYLGAKQHADSRQQAAQSTTMAQMLKDIRKEQQEDQTKYESNQKTLLAAVIKNENAPTKKAEVTVRPKPKTDVHAAEAPHISAPSEQLTNHQLSELQPLIKANDVLSNKAEDGVAHLTFLQERIVSTDSNNPYVLRVIVQTDKTIHNPDFYLLCDGKITGGDFMIVGSGVQFEHYAGYSNTFCGFRFHFSYPDFTPDAPVVATIPSTTEFHITGIKDARGEPW